MPAHVAGSQQRETTQRDVPRSARIWGFFRQISPGLSEDGSLTQTRELSRIAQLGRPSHSLQGAQGG